MKKNYYQLTYLQGLDTDRALKPQWFSEIYLFIGPYYASPVLQVPAVFPTFLVCGSFLLCSFDVKDMVWFHILSNSIFKNGCSL